MTFWLQRQWYQQRRLAPALWLLLPLHALFVAVSGLRRGLYRLGVLLSVRLPVPVVVIGNLVAGGAGKTPLVLWLAGELQRRGYRPGILSRGYGGADGRPQPVDAATSPAQAGDEPVLLARRSGVPLWVGRDRAAAGQALLAAHPEVNVLICDDGLQHYRLARDAEIVVFDRRGAGNGWRLPLGPLREPLARLRSVDVLVFNGEVEAVLAAGRRAFAMRLQPGDFYRLDDPVRTCTVVALQGKALHALAGIGEPQRFFDTLRQLGLEFTPHPFADHHAYTAADLDFGPQAVLLMTEKDAVKCAGLCPGEAWVLPVTAELPPTLADLLLEKFDGR